jgi:hypothetical protein
VSDEEGERDGIMEEEGTWTRDMLCNRWRRQTTCHNETSRHKRGPGGRGGGGRRRRRRKQAQKYRVGSSGVGRARGGEGTEGIGEERERETEREREQAKEEGRKEAAWRRGTTMTSYIEEIHHMHEYTREEG